MKTKKCYGCKQELPIDNFTKNKNNKDGLSYYCRDCSKKNYTLNKYKNTNKKEYEAVIIEELKKNGIPIDGVDKDKINIGVFNPKSIYQLNQLQTVIQQKLKIQYQH